MFVSLAARGGDGDGEGENEVWFDRCDFIFDGG